MVYIARLTHFLKLVTVLFVTVFCFSVAEASSSKTTYQARIIKPNGTPLQAANVGFRFTITDPSGNCVLYAEDYTNVNMTGSGGQVNFSLGNGAVSFSAVNTTTKFKDVFDNFPASGFTCRSGGSTTTYIPQLNDSRKIVMQFNDGMGWQTLPAMAINAVPYSFFSQRSNLALNSNLLEGKPAAAYLEKVDIDVCPAQKMLQFNGLRLECIDIPSVYSLTTTGPLTNTGTASNPVLDLPQATTSVSGYLAATDFVTFNNKLNNNYSAVISALGFAPVSAATVNTMATSVASSLISSALASQTLTGDVSGNFNLTQVDYVGGKTASEISQVVNDVQAATSTDTGSTLVKRDSSGNFSANQIGVNTIKYFKPSSALNVSLEAPNDLISSYSLKFPSAPAASGSVITVDGSGQLSWSSPTAGSVTSVQGTSGEINVSGGFSPQISLATVYSNASTVGSNFEIPVLQIDSKGRITSASSVNYRDATNSVKGVLSVGSNLSVAAGQISLTGTNVNSALGYVPADSAAVTAINKGGTGLSVSGTAHQLLGMNSTASGLEYKTVSAGTNISITNSAGQLVINSTNPGGTVTNVSANAPLAVVNSTSTPQISLNLSSDLTTSGTNLALSPSGVSANTYGSAVAIPVLQIDNKGRITNASTVAVNSSQWTTSGTNIFYNSGNVGIGTNNPRLKLDVNGPINKIGGDIIQTVFVDASGADTNDGLSSTTPVLTIQKAIDIANSYTDQRVNIRLTGIVNLSANRRIYNKDLHFQRTDNLDTNWNATLSLIQSSVNFDYWSVTSSAEGFQGNIILNASPAFRSLYGHNHVTAGGFYRTTFVLGANNLIFVARDTGDNGAEGGSEFHLNLNYRSGFSNPSSFTGFLFDSSTGANSTNQSKAYLHATSIPSFMTMSNYAIYVGNNGSEINYGSSYSYPNATLLEVSGSVRVGFSTTCGVGQAGAIRYSAGNLEFCNGSTFTTLGLASSGVTLLNGSSSQTQSFAIGTSGNSPAFVTAAGVHTLNIPLASTTNVTAGLISNADYNTFNNKLSTLDLGSVSATGTLAVGRLPAFTGDVTSSIGSNILTLASVGSGVVSGTQYTKVTVDGKGRVTSGSNLSFSDVTSALGYTPANATSATQWATVGSTINYTAGNVGIGTTSPGEKIDIAGNMRVGSSDSNYIAFRGSTGDGAGLYNHTYIGERLYSGPEASELLLFKGNDSDNGSGPDRIRMAAGNIVFDTYASPDAPSGSFETVAQSPLISTKMIIKGSGNVGIGTTTPAAKLDVQGQIRPSMGTPLTNPAGNAVDFITGNTQYVTFSTCPGNALTVNLYSMLEGGSYSLVVEAPNGCLVDFTGISHANGGSGGVAVTSFRYPAAQKFSSTGNPMVYSFLRANNRVFVAQVVDFQ